MKRVRPFLMLVVCAASPLSPRADDSDRGRDAASADAAAAAEAAVALAEAEAEHTRLSVEMERLAQRLAWKGVERKYIQLLALGIDLNQTDHLHGAYAARELGDVSACYDRLRAAADHDASKEVIDWLWDIDNNYGHVVLETSPARAAVLTMDEMPFDPNQRRAVEAAVEVVREDGTFSGLLPLGGYDFAGQRFSVQPGISVRIEVSPRARRQGAVEPVILYRETPRIYVDDDSQSAPDAE